METGETATIRSATSIDAPEIASVHVASWLETYGGMVPDSMLVSISIERRMEFWKQVLDASDTHASTQVRVAEVDTKIVGFAACCAQRSAALKEKSYDGEIAAVYS
jgi:hypothetical protein